MTVGADRPHIYVRPIKSGLTLGPLVSQCCSSKISSSLLTAFCLGRPSHLVFNPLLMDSGLCLSFPFCLIHGILHYYDYLPPGVRLTLFLFFYL